MQTQDLKIYTQLYELRSINKTAQTLQYSQSNITARLQALENELQTQLFRRSFQGLQPTAAGELTYTYAQQVLAATAHLTAQLHETNARQSVVISELLFNYLVVEQQRFDLKDYDFQIKSSTAIATLADTATPLIITYADFHHPAYTEMKRNWLTSAFVSCDGQLNDRPYLINSDTHCPFRRQTLATVPAAATLAVDSWNSIITLVQQGRGVALLPRYVAQAHDLQPLSDYKQVRIPYRTFALQA